MVSFLDRSLAISFVLVAKFSVSSASFRFTTSAILLVASVPQFKERCKCMNSDENGLFLSGRCPEPMSFVV